MEKLNKEEFNKKGYPFIVMGILLIFICSIILINNHFKKVNKKSLEEKSIQTFFKNIEPENRQIQNINKKEIIEYIAVIEIPKINLKHGLVDINSKYNNINKNITILAESTMPNIKYGNFILAAHSGNSEVSFFKNIHKLKNNDLINIYYKDNIYKYKIFNIYEIEKIGKTTLELDNKNTFITLITCIPKTNKQLIVMGKKT